MLFKKRDAWARPLAEYDVITRAARQRGREAARPDRAARAARRRAGRGRSAPRRPPRPTCPTPSKAPLPTTLAPQLATLVDGGRRAATGSTRSSSTATASWPHRGRPGAPDHAQRPRLDREDAAAGRRRLQPLDIDRAWLDGEIVVLDDDGMPDFNALQNAFDSRASERDRLLPVRRCRSSTATTCARCRCDAARALLKRLLDEQATASACASAPTSTADPASLLQSACQLGLEGVIVKREDAPYVSRAQRDLAQAQVRGSGRSSSIGGFTDRAAARAPRSAACCSAITTTAGCCYAGSVGTGWDSTTGAPLHRAPGPARSRAARRSSRQPSSRALVAARAAAASAGSSPQLVAEVRSANGRRTATSGTPSFKGLRTDKPAQEVTRETVAPRRPAVAAARRAAERVERSR